MAKIKNSKMTRDALLKAVIAVILIALVLAIFSGFGGSICLGAGVLIFVLLFVHMFLWETVDIEYDAHVAASEMRKINTAETTGWLELILKGDFRTLAMRKGPKTAAIIYFLSYSAVPLPFLIAYLFFGNSHPPANDPVFYAVMFLTFVAFIAVRAYSRKKVYERAMVLMENGEIEEKHYEAEPTFPLEKR